MRRISHHRRKGLTFSFQFPILFLFILVSACGPQKGKLRIYGEFENLPHADVLLYSKDGGLPVPLDTLHIRKGRFDYQTAPDDAETHTYILVYPNFSTLTFMARRGTEVRIQGDALSLSQVNVEGADSVIRQEKKSGKALIAIDRPLPKSKIIKQKKGTYLLIGFMADWKYGSSQVTFHTQRALQEHPDSLTAFTYLLDIDKTNIKPVDKAYEERWQTYCDFRGWSGPLLARYGIRNIPLFILVNPKGKVVAMGSDYNRDIKAAMERVP